MHFKTIFVFISVMFPYVLLAQNTSERKSIEAYRLQDGDKIELDGNLSELFWKDIQPATDFLQQEPVEGSKASEKTVVKVSYDKQNLYIGVILYDSDPTQIKAFQRRRDQPLDTDDRFVFVLDSYNDQRSAYYFEINPAGLMRDGLIRTGQGTNLNIAWDGIWRAWVKEGDYGWSAEIRIPLMTLNFNPENDIWGINFQRSIRRKNENVLWSGHLRNQGILRPQNTGKLTGLNGLSQGVGLEVIPYALATHVNQKENDIDEVSFATGGEVNYSITPNLRAAVTINTDFAETEVDDRQVNLSRFPLVFPERRDFFLEGSSNYLFATSSSPNPYFSRRIGLQEGRSIPIEWGARLNGRIKQTDLYFLQVRTGEDGDRPAENFTVGRVLQSISSESPLGAIYTRRNDADGLSPTQQTFGADLELNTSNFMGDNNLQFQAFLVMHTPTDFDDKSTTFDRSTRGLRINFPNQPWSGHVSYREFGVNYDPAVGFAPRVGFKRLQPTITYSPLLEKSKLFREISFSYNFEYLMDMDFSPATVNHTIRLLGLRFESGDNFRAEYLHNYERLNADFDILRDGRFIIPVGDYYNQGYRLSFNSAAFRRVGGSFNFRHIGFWTGKRDDYELSVFLRPFTGLNIDASWINRQVRLDEGSFNTQILRMVTAYDFSPWVSLNFNVQYDNVTELLATNNRFTWVIQPGKTLFVVYNHNWNHSFDNDRLVTAETRTNIKLSYTVRF